MKRKLLHFVCALVAAATTFTASAGSISPVVPIGGGKFMITGRNTTVFGSSDGIAAKLMIEAHKYCGDKGKGEAVLLDMSGESAAMGVRTASSTVYFRCTTEEAGPTKQVASAALPNSYYERVDEIKARVLNGEIAATKGIVSSNVSPSFRPLSVSDAEMLEGRSIWWAEQGNWYIHIPNVSASTLEAFELSITPGTCRDAAKAAKQVIVVQLARPIEASADGVISFKSPTPTDDTLCSVITKAWSR